MHCRAFWCGLLAKAARLPPPPPPLAFHISAEVSAAPLPPPHNEPEAGAALRREACGAGGSRIGRAARQRARVGLDLVVDINVEHVVFVVASGDVSKAEVAVKSHGFGIVGGAEHGDAASDPLGQADRLVDRPQQKPGGHSLPLVALVGCKIADV